MSGTPGGGRVKQNDRARPLLGSRATTLLVVLVAIALSLLTLAFMSVELRYVAGPGLACAVILLWLIVSLWQRDRIFPLFDLGFFCALATFVYSVYPLLNYWSNGLEFSYADLSDTRLSIYAPTPLEIGTFHLRHVLYLFSFAVSYLWFCGRGAVTSSKVESPPLAAQYVIVISFVVLAGFFAVLKWTTGITYDTGYAPDEFAKNVRALSSAPLWLSQISGKLAGIGFVMKLGLLFVVVSRSVAGSSRRAIWLSALGLWVAVEVLHAFVLKGGRGGMVLFLLATVLLYHRLVRPLSFKKLAALGGAVFALFIFLGLYRSFADLSALRSELRQADAGLFAGNNEFQALLATAYDVAQRKAAGTPLPGYLYMNDFVDILPPQQLLPFRKVTASEWYVAQLGITGSGTGYMWGVITQSIVGLDWIELAFRGILLGLTLGVIHRWYRKRQSQFLPTYAYMFLCIHVHLTFRNTTFAILANIVWELIPFCLIVATSVLLMTRHRFAARPTVITTPGGAAGLS